jgi:hypothetical protein
MPYDRDRRKALNPGMNLWVLGMTGVICLTIRTDGRH